MNRKNKKGGGVALYVSNKLNYKVVESMSTIVDDVMECLSVEIIMGKQKNVIVSCVYRAPGSSIETFNNCLEGVVAKNNQKVMFLCGDFNTDLQNLSKHKLTDDFMDTMYSFSLYPLITKPSRITTHCASLINNIFTNCMEKSLVSGLMINDISDHLTVFVIYDCDCKKQKEELKIKFKRIRTDDSIMAFRAEIQAQNWENLYKENNINIAYEAFLKVFQTLCDKTCPIKQHNMRQNNSNRPWITKGLQNACKLFVQTIYKV